MLSRTRKAFTMLELIVVIVILGILALLAIPTFAKVIERVRLNSVKSSAASVGREAVALAAFDSESAYNKTVTEADDAVALADKNSDGVVDYVDEAFGDLPNAAQYTLGEVEVATGGGSATFTLIKNSDPKLQATVTITGNTVSAEAVKLP